MNKKWNWIVGAVAFVLLMTGAGIFYNWLAADYQRNEENVGPDTVQSGYQADAGAEKTERTPETQESAADANAEQTVAAVDFSMLDTVGETVQLSAHFGKPVVLNFWATWCGPCQAEMPYFNEAYGQYGEQVDFMMVNLTDGVRDTVESAGAFVQEQGYTFPVYFDAQQQGMYAYGVMSIPTTLLINEQGEIVSYYVGSMTREILFDLLEQHLHVSSLPAQEAVQETAQAAVTYVFRNAKLLNQHYEKHGIEMGFASAAEYEAAASAVINNPNALYKTEKEDGDGVYYVEETNEFVILSTDGYIRTYFQPSNGIKYFNKQ
ncbi:MAG: redoxin domain-containing protein [Lachnospiraceae bacterium]|nr:redoxin domain-containing protein [Lachnospiraceae bacterium]